ncbi:hypothetical protein, partial [Burkholderia ambifaria]
MLRLSRTDMLGALGATPMMGKRDSHASDDSALAAIALFRRANAKTPAFWAGVSGLGSLTITYFHTGIRTIIGVESFHG